jgi:hypothetical protein
MEFNGPKQCITMMKKLNFVPALPNEISFCKDLFDTVVVTASPNRIPEQKFRNQNPPNKPKDSMKSQNVLVSIACSKFENMAGSPSWLTIGY